MKTYRIADYYFSSLLWATLLSLLFLSLFFLVLLFREGKSEIYAAGRLVEDARKGEVKGHVLRTLNLIEYLRSTYPQSSDREIQDWVLKRLETIRFGSGGYIFVIQKDGVLLLSQAGKELRGSNLFASEDPETVQVAVECLRAAATPGGDFAYYSWERPGGDRKERKISFVSDVSDWAWMVGGGVYIGDLDALIQKEIDRIRLNLLGDGALLLLVFSLLIGVAIFVYRRYAQEIRNDTGHLTRVMMKVGEDRGLGSVGAFRFLEFRNLADRMAETLEALEKSRREAETALREKEILFKEIHHRVKNNLQIIISLLRLSDGSSSDGKAGLIFLDMENRIRSMALLHELLYESDDIANIRMDEYFTRLLLHLKSGYEELVRNLSFDSNLEAISLDIDRALPCGLLVNELISNSLKHAFSSSSEKEKTIRLSFSVQGDLFRLVVCDNGRGIPGKKSPKDFSSVGVMLIRALSEQLKGTCRLEAESGTCWTILFPR